MLVWALPCVCMGRPCSSMSSQAAQAAERTPHPVAMALAALAARSISLGRGQPWQLRNTEAASWSPPCRHVALRRSVSTHAADGDARAQLLEEVALAFSAEDVQAMRGRKVG